MKKVILALILCSPINTNALEISDFKSGLMCGTNIDEIGYICSVQTDINITGQSICKANQQVAMCTWYGFSFDYTNAIDSDLIECTYKLSTPVRVVNIEELAAASTNEGSFSFGVKSGDGHFINPQYTLYSSSSTGAKQSIVTTCNYKDTVIFNYQINTEIL